MGAFWVPVYASKYVYKIIDFGGLRSHIV